MSNMSDNPNNGLTTGEASVVCLALGAGLLIALALIL